MTPFRNIRPGCDCINEMRNTLAELRDWFSRLKNYPPDLARGSAASCLLPWPGVWIKGDRELNITQHQLGPLGSCRSKNNDQYLLSSATDRGDCFRCLIVFPVHANVLQYKSTQCIFDSSMTLERCRHHFSGDTTMYTLFRMSEVECIASWHSLGHTFFAARVGNRRGESYRCFIVDQTGTSGRIGISADASCQELTHIGAATTTLHYKQDHKIHSQCDFPDYLRSHPHGRLRHSWESIVTGKRNVVQNGNWISSYKTRNDTVWTCLESRQHPEFTAVRAHIRRGCLTGYQCVQFHRRAHNMVQVNFGQVSLNEYEDCSEMTVETRDTLVLNGAQEECPLRGRYSIPSCQHPLLFIGCHKPDEIQITTECNPLAKDSDLYSCAASFEATNGEHYLVVRDELSAQYQCMKINTDNDVVMKLYDHVACDPVSTGAALPSLVVNISSTERCESSLLAGFLYYSRGSTAIQSPFILAVFLFIFDILL
ncbi:hypothetical protein Q1695_010911 [Nippostrongylus brasiliensis]|nr:hypothetical protein Q1695_010911 [Nippostrongylus brasiliensis]